MFPIAANRSVKLCFRPVLVLLQWGVWCWSECVSIISSSECVSDQDSCVMAVIVDSCWTLLCDVAIIRGKRKPAVRDEYHTQSSEWMQQSPDLCYSHSNYAPCLEPDYCVTERRHRCCVCTAVQGCTVSQGNTVMSTRFIF